MRGYRRVVWLAAVVLVAATVLLVGCAGAQNAIDNANPAGRIDKMKIAAGAAVAQGGVAAADTMAATGGEQLDPTQVEALKTKLTSLKDAPAEQVPQIAAEVDAAFQGLIDKVDADASTSAAGSARQVLLQKVSVALVKAKTDLAALVDK